MVTGTMICWSFFETWGLRLSVRELTETCSGSWKYMSYLRSIFAGICQHTYKLHGSVEEVAWVICSTLPVGRGANLKTAVPQRLQILRSTVNGSDGSWKQNSLTIRPAKLDWSEVTKKLQWSGICCETRDLAYCFVLVFASQRLTLLVSPLISSRTGIMLVC
jgi:hypothetical protein